MKRMYYNMIEMQRVYYALSFLETFLALVEQNGR